MKRIGCFLLLLVMMFTTLISCGSSNKTENVVESETETSPTETVVETEEINAVEVLEQAIGENVDVDSLKVKEVTTVGEDTVVKYEQTYNDIEIKGASMVVVDGEESLVFGKYYDMENAFGDDFDELIAEAGEIPDWMVNGKIGEVSVTYHTETLKPIIYIDGDEAVVARSIKVTLSENGSSAKYNMVFSVDGKLIYEYSSDFNGFTSILGEDGTFVAEKNGKQYAYDMENRLFISNFIEENADKLDDYYDGSGAIVDEKYIYCFGDGNDEEIRAVLRVMADVMEWYDVSFGYNGVDGNGGEAMLFYGISAAELDSIAANASGYGHVFYLAIDPDYGTAVEAPEILAHEMGHAVLKNKVKLDNSNQSGSLHEAISDVFACLYDENKDWVIGEGKTDTYKKNIQSYTLTMKDFRYDSLYTSDEYQPAEYIGDNKLLVYIREHFIDPESCSIAKYRNSRIVSGAMHKIWRDIYNKDSILMGRVLMDSLEYLPEEAEFGDFRAAFMYSTGKFLGNDKMKKVGMLFDTYGIYHEKERFVAVRQKDKPDCILDIMDMTYGEVRMLEWDSCDFTSTFTDWYCLCYKGNIKINLGYKGSDIEHPQALPDKLSLSDYNDVLTPIPIMDKLSLGMLYWQVAADLDVTPLEYSEFQSPLTPGLAIIETDKYRLELSFTGLDENAVLKDVRITRK